MGAIAEVESCIDKNRELKAKVQDKLREIAFKKNYPLTELGNAERFIDENSNYLLFCPEKDIWFLWTGKRWVAATENILLSRAKATVRNILLQSKECKDPVRAEELYKHWEKSDKISHLSQIIKGARLDSRIQIRLEKMDDQPWLLNCTNGVVDLRTGDVSEHDRELFLTHLLDVPYEEDSECEHWENFINSVTGGDKRLQRYLQRIAGYALSGDIGQKCMFLIFGPTDTGKTTFLETLRDLMGSELTRKADLRSFLRKGYQSRVRTDLARLAKARMVISAEAATDDSFDEAVLRAC